MVALFLISKVGVLALYLLNHPDLEVICGVSHDVKIGIYWFSRDSCYRYQLRTK